MVVHDRGTSFGTVWQLLPHGIHRTTRPIPPGRYRLVLRSDGYAEQTIPLDLRAGAAEEVDVTLERQ